MPIHRLPHLFRTLLIVALFAGVLGACAPQERQEINFVFMRTSDLTEPYWQEVIAAFEQASGRKLPYAIVDRRPGDVPISFANSEKAAKELGWGADKDIARMCADAWRWQLQNPDGY